MEEGHDNTDLILASEEAAGVSFPLNRRYKAWIILDNASIHKVKAVQEMFARRKYGLVFLPPYSPALNPIEMAFSKIKSAFKSPAIRAQKVTADGIMEACKTLTSADCGAYIAKSLQMIPLCINGDNLPV